MDSDDTVEPEYLEKIHKAVLETGADFAICSSQCIDETGKTLAGCTYTAVLLMDHPHAAVPFCC